MPRIRPRESAPGYHPRCRPSRWSAFACPRSPGRESDRMRTIGRIAGLERGEQYVVSPDHRRVYSDPDDGQAWIGVYNEPSGVGPKRLLLVALGISRAR